MQYRHSEVQKYIPKAIVWTDDIYNYTLPPIDIQLSSFDAFGVFSSLAERA